MITGVKIYDSWKLEIYSMFNSLYADGTLMTVVYMFMNMYERYLIFVGNFSHYILRGKRLVSNFDKPDFYHILVLA